MSLYQDCTSLRPGCGVKLGNPLVVIIARIVFYPCPPFMTGPCDDNWLRFPVIF